MQSHEPSAAQIVFGCYVSSVELHISFILPNLFTLQPDTFTLHRCSVSRSWFTGTRIRVAYRIRLCQKFLSFHTEITDAQYFLLYVILLNRVWPILFYWNSKYPSKRKPRFLSRADGIRRIIETCIVLWKRPVHRQNCVVAKFTISTRILSNLSCSLYEILVLQSILLSLLVLEISYSIFLRHLPSSLWLTALINRRQLFVFDYKLSRVASFYETRRIDLNIALVQSRAYRSARCHSHYHPKMSSCDNMRSSQRIAVRCSLQDEILSKHVSVIPSFCDSKYVRILR